MSKITRELQAEGRAARATEERARCVASLQVAIDQTSGVEALAYLSRDGLRQHESIHIEPPEFLKKRIYDELCEHGVPLGGLCVLCPDSTAWSPFTLHHDEDFLS